MSDKLPPFGTIKACPACGWDGHFHSKYRASVRGRLGAALLEDLSPRMERTCPGCGYSWDERPLYEDEDECCIEACDCEPITIACDELLSASMLLLHLNECLEGAAGYMRRYANLLESQK